MLEHSPLHSIAVPGAWTPHKGHNELHPSPCFPQKLLLLLGMPRARICRAGGERGELQEGWERTGTEPSGVCQNG